MSTTLDPVNGGGGGGGALPFAHIRRVLPRATYPAQLASNADNYTNLNTVEEDAIGITLKGTFEITIPAGEYRIEAKIPLRYTLGSKALWYKEAGNVLAITGDSIWSDNGAVGNTVATLFGKFTSADEDFTLRLRCAGQGYPGYATISPSPIVEVYESIKLWKLA